MVRGRGASIKQTLILLAVILGLAVFMAEQTNTFCASNLSCTVSGAWTYSAQIASSVSTGTAPLSIASTTVVPNLNAQFHNGLAAPASSIVGTLDSQTLANKTLTSPTINTPTINGLSVANPVAQALAQTGAATNYGVALSTQTVVSSVPATGMVTISSQGVQTLVGVGCSASANNVTATFSYTAPGSTVLTWTGITFTITGNGTIDPGDLGATDSGNLVKIAAKAGTAITYTTSSALGSTGCSTIPQYTIFAKAFF